MTTSVLRRGVPARRPVDDFENKIASVTKEIVTVCGMPVPHAETRTRLRESIESRVARLGENPFSYFQNGEPTFVYAELPKELLFEHYVMIEGVDRVLDKIMAGIESNGRPIGLPVAERKVRVDALQAELFDAECDAERATLVLEASGHVVVRRGDCDVNALLLVWGELGEAPVDIEKAAI